MPASRPGRSRRHHPCGIIRRRAVRCCSRPRAITKSYEGVRALRGVSFDLRAGEVHALVGENGAGKSTLIKVMTGAVTPDAGTLTVAGQPVPRMTPAISRALGIAAIYQQPSLFPHLTVAENIALALETGSAWRRVDWRARAAPRGGAARRASARRSLPTGWSRRSACRSSRWSRSPRRSAPTRRILIMDEPTASLTEREAAHLFEVIARLRADGAGVIYISHRLEEIFTIADRITVLRDGETVATARARRRRRAPTLIRADGRPRARRRCFPSATVRDRRRRARAARRRASRRPASDDISLSVRRGEILGLAGLVGSGRTELAEVIFGLRPADAGEILLDGQARDASDRPRAAIRAGIAYVPEDRRQHGVVLEMSVAANASLANLAGVSRARADRPRRRAAQRARLRRRRCASRRRRIDAEVGSLSGGNQQKVALARWLETQPVGADPRRADAGRRRRLEGGDPRADGQRSPSAAWRS